MVFGGPVGGGWGWFTVFVLVAVQVSLLAGTGGLIAWSLARRWQAAVLGTVAFAATAWWLVDRTGPAWGSAVVAGWAASALVGGALRLMRSVDPRWTTLVLVLVALGAAGAGVSTASAGRTERATAATRSVAEQVGSALVASDGRTANDLALEAVSGRPDTTVLRAEGDRRSGGAEIVVRITAPSGGGEALGRCWRYRLAGETGDGLAEPVGCPDVTVTRIAGNYGDNLDGALTFLDPGSLDDLAEIRRMVETHVEQYLEGDDIRVEVDRLDERTIGIAVEVGLTDCLVTRLVPSELGAPVVDPLAPGPVDTWPADPADLRSGGIGCSPALASTR